ncbi:hypothetical protein GVAV_001230 [Gurleya vavrai]
MFVNYSSYIYIPKNLLFINQIVNFIIWLFSLQKVNTSSNSFSEKNILNDVDNDTPLLYCLKFDETDVGELLEQAIQAYDVFFKENLKNKKLIAFEIHIYDAKYTSDDIFEKENIVYKTFKSKFEETLKMQNIITEHPNSSQCNELNNCKNDVISKNSFDILVKRPIELHIKIIETYIKYFDVLNMSTILRLKLSKFEYHSIIKKIKIPIKTYTIFCSENLKTISVETLLHFISLNEKTNETNKYNIILYLQNSKNVIKKIKNSYSKKDKIDGLSDKPATLNLLYSIHIVTLNNIYMKKRYIDQDVDDFFDIKNLK